MSGGALPIHGGIIISMERFNNILQIDERNLQATVEPGVINYIFQEEVKKVGLFYPPDPASWGSCSLGGNVAHSSGGPKAVKYGTTRDYVLNIEMVLPNGQNRDVVIDDMRNAETNEPMDVALGSHYQIRIPAKGVDSDMVLISKYLNA